MQQIMRGVEETAGKEGGGPKKNNKKTRTA